MTDQKLMYQSERQMDRLLEIMAALRTPGSGCPWDLEQDFASIAPYTIEEAYEVADAIKRDDRIDLRDELGDLLLQVVFHARLAEEEGSFDFDDVAEAISKKMIRRHPHVFGSDKADNAKDVKLTWEQIKQQERAEKKAERTAKGLKKKPEEEAYLASVPFALPALTRALKIQQRAAQVGFDWSEAPPILDKITEETEELREAIDQGDQNHIKEEYGDLLFALVNLGRHLEIDSEQALQDASDKFINRFHIVEKAIINKGKTLEESSLEEMEFLWQEAKKS